VQIFMGSCHEPRRIVARHRNSSIGRYNGSGPPDAQTIARETAALASRAAVAEQVRSLNEWP
jgi:hypothetical protein